MKKVDKKEYTFNIFNNYAKKGVSTALTNIIGSKKAIICSIGSDLVLGDSVGPLVGSILQENKVDTFIYGTLKNPVTAKEISYIKKYLTSIHKNIPIIAVDAALGNKDEVGLIKVVEGGLRPGLGVNKNFSYIGDVSIMAIVAEKGVNGEKLLRLTRLNLVYKFAEIISEGIYDFFNTENKLNTFFNNKNSLFVTKKLC
ncbi:MAG: spore protease YyaC [Clostridiales bacterium]|nr:spore protease YyaC [Clostridiales bacterium]